MFNEPKQVHEAYEKSMFISSKRYYLHSQNMSALMLPSDVIRLVPWLRYNGIHRMLQVVFQMTCFSAKSNQVNTNTDLIDK